MPKEKKPNFISAAFTRFMVGLCYKMAAVLQQRHPAYQHMTVDQVYEAVYDRTAKKLGRQNG
jgi:hypothetical protein